MLVLQACIKSYNLNYTFMKKFILISLLLLPGLHVQAQMLEFDAYHYGVIGGSRHTELDLIDLDNNSFVKREEEVNYFGVNLGTFYSFAELGEFQTGLEIDCDIAFGRTKKVIDEYGNASFSMPFLYLGGAILAKIYFGESEEAAFFLAVGPHVSHQQSSKISPLQYGPKIEFGRQFLIADFPVSLSAYFEYGLNSPAKRFIYGNQAVKSFSQQSFGAKVSFAIW